jgi:hypothetical protein
MRDDPFTPADLESACDDLAMLAYFPRDARASVMRLLRVMCPHRRALKWLVAELVNHVNYWPGPAEVRGLLCTRFDPADGIDQWCSLPGYTAEEAEAKHFDRHQQLAKTKGWIAEESAEIVKQLASKAKQIPTAKVSEKRA